MRQAMTRWTPEQAWEWYERQPWLCGFNYVPRTAVNSLEMWQEETFDLPTIRQELDWAHGIGLNTCRVYLPFLLWRHDAEGLLRRLDRFLETAEACGLSSMIVLFDDCDSVGRSPRLGDQGPPIPGVHNSRWTPSPGHEEAADHALRPALEAYVVSVVRRYGQDERVVMWDVYNEPGQSGMGGKSLPLLHDAFVWARSAGPRQPLTAAIYSGPPPSLGGTAETPPPVAALADAALEASDIVSFHDYCALPHLEDQVRRLQALGRPLVCTEWLCRPLGSHVETHLPLLARERVGCYFWGLVNGRTQTQFPWGAPAGAAEPELWFHDLLRGDGTPFRSNEVAAFQQHLLASAPASLRQ